MVESVTTTSPTSPTTSPTSRGGNFAKRQYLHSGLRLVSGYAYTFAFGDPHRDIKMTQTPAGLSELCTEQLWKQSIEEVEAAPAPHTPTQFSWEWFGPGELMALQEQMELMPLLTLRMTSKAVCDNLDHVMPPAVRLAHWILHRFKKLCYHRSRGEEIPCNNGNLLYSAHNRMLNEPCMLRAPTRLLVDTYALFDGMESTICWEDKDLPLDNRYTRCSTFSMMFHQGLARALKERIGDVIHGDGGRGTLIPYEGTTAAEHAAIFGPPQPLSEEESIALLDDIFDRAGKATGPAEMHEVTFRVEWSPFIMAALEGKVGVLRYLADRTKDMVGPDGVCYGALRRDDHGNNTYAYVLNDIDEKVERYEGGEEDFPDPETFDEVWSGETYALYMARRRDELKTKYTPVLAYLRDELGLKTRRWRNGEEESTDEESESEEEPSESDEEEEEEEV